ncbi:MAG: heparinase II/III family protein [Candidatus Hydrogenedentota bacterium]
MGAQTYIARWWRTVRRLRPIQVRYRLWYMVRRRIERPLFRWAHARARRGGAGLAPILDAPSALEATPARLDMADAVAGGTFTFLNETRTFTAMPTWGATDPGAKLWLYNLHYFDYAPALAAAARETGDAIYMDTLAALMRSWLAACGKPGEPPFAWDAGPLSHRLLNWCRVLLAARATLNREAGLLENVTGALFTQALYLEKHLEYHLLGNHLITNAAALLYAGTVLEGRAPCRWRRRGSAILRRQLRTQVLPDGGHVERSPMYHALVLKDYLDCLALERHAGAHWFTGEDRRVIGRMARFLASIAHPDGEIPLLNDAAFAVAPPPPKLLAAAAELLDMPDLAPGHGAMALPDTGLFIDRGQGHFLVFDAGPVGPDYNPAHAHGDTLGFELSLGKQRVLVDTGVCSYAGDSWRTYCESTRAHNTLDIDGAGQIEKWGRYHFRAGRRPYPRGVTWYERDRLTVFEGGHTGYDHLPGRPRHMRSLVRVDQAFWVIVDVVRGHHHHAITSYLHFHPDTAVNLEDAAAWAVFPGGCMRIVPLGGTPCILAGSVTPPLQGWYCPRFGVRIPQPVLELAETGPLPHFLGWILSPGEVAVSASWEVVHDTLCLRCRRGGAHYELRGAPGKTYHLRTGPASDVASPGPGV